jgi:hypothetical protein
MKQGKTLTELAAEIERQAKSKADYVADTRQMVLHSNGTSKLAVGNQGEFEVTEHTHRQIAEFADVPKAYYDRLRKDAPELLDRNVNHWFAEAPKRRMVRTLDGNARAFLSDRYRPLDNYELLEAVLPTLLETPGLSLASCEVTESRLYIKATTDRITGEVKVGDVVQAGIVISNSEIGAGAISVTPMSLRLICVNGAVHNDMGTRRNHVGRIADAGEDAFRLYADETIQADDRAFWLKTRDTVKSTLTEATFNKILAQMREAASVTVAHPVEAIEVLANRFRLPEVEKSSILTNLIQGADLSMWGVANAITATAQDVPSYDRATELETLGGSLLSMTGDWSSIVNAKPSRRQFAAAA